tara:strand:+ start:315 stop:566 length:252 start_codon:yes stop_codon:yes gene_type:complete
LINGVFYINFKVTGFDDDPMTSLIIECGKEECINQEKAHDILNLTKENYNRYAYSLTRFFFLAASLKYPEIMWNYCKSPFKKP